MILDTEYMALDGEPQGEPLPRVDDHSFRCPECICFMDEYTSGELWCAGCGLGLKEKKTIKNLLRKGWMTWTEKMLDFWQK